MKRIGIALLSIFFLQEIFIGSSARACNKASDQHLQILLKEKKFVEAETWAQARVKDQPDHPNTHLALASVYLHQAAEEVIHLNSEAVGIPAGESGTAKITPENLKQVFQPKIHIIPEYAGKASAVLEEVVQRWPDQRQAYFCLLDLYQKSAEHKKFLKATDRLSQTFDKEGKGLVDELLPYAVNYAKENQFQLAGDFYEVLLKHFPQSEKLLSSYGVVRLKLGHLDEGINYFKRAHKIQPSDPIILCNIGEGSIYQQQFKQARKYFNLCLKEAPQRIAIYFDLAIIAMADGPKTSIPAWEEYLQKNKTYPDHPAWAKSGRQIMEGIKAGTTPEAIENLSSQFIQSRAPKLAVPLISWLIKENPSEPVYPFLLSQAYDQQGFYRQAYQQTLRTEKLLLKHPGHLRLKVADVRFELGRLAYALQKWDESAGYLEKVMKENPKAPNLQYLLGLVEIERGHKGAARRYFQECLDQANNAQYVTYCRQNLKSP